MDRGARDSGVTLAELLAAFSLATDLGLGQPMEHVLRSWWISCQLGQRMNLDADERRSLFFIALLSWVGCVADSPEVSAWFGDDIAFRGDSYDVELAGLEGLGFLLRHAGVGGSLLRRFRLATALTLTGSKSVVRGMRTHCVNTSAMAAQLGLGPEVCHPLRQFFTRWDGRGVPAGVGGEDLAVTIRLFQLADVVEVHHRAGGVRAATDVARARRGTHFDPTVVDVFCADAAEVLGEGQEPRECRELIRSDPLLQHHLSEDELDERLLALADFTDLRSTYRAGHSRGVAALAADAARLAGLPEDDVAVVRRAGLMHDIGLHGVPASILDKPGPLTEAESERMRMSSYYTERVLARPEPLARFGAVAALVHERMDGSGAHRGLTGSAIPATARILAAADIYRSMTEPRSHRPALSSQDAARSLRDEVRAGRVASDAADAVLAAAGRPGGRRVSGPAGLTPRELEVLVHIARGASTRQVAKTLGISAKTAGTHIERIYVKTGASSRATATLFAVQHGLIDAQTPPGL